MVRDSKFVMGDPFSNPDSEVISAILRMSDGIFPAGLVICSRYPRDTQFGERAVARISVVYIILIRVR
ncbi:hypothetical protein OUZ56_033232 [Daphnia magna]|uniref:Uncharacterized protein n=1 Tax=Daphnia magna TaxID=35525 RepID=A0ABQ9ZXG0_9CRUS|nr:hypothetical protein OUZ56_033232 [Daphnia magna]